MRHAEKQNHVSNGHFGFCRQPTIHAFSEHAILLHRFAARYCKWSGAELEAATKCFSIPRRVLLVKTLDPIPHPWKVRTTKQVDHEKANARIARGDEAQFEFRVQQLRSVMFEFR